MKIAMIGQKTIGVKGGRAGGIETHVEMLASRLAERGHEVFAYARADYHRSGTTPPAAGSKSVTSSRLSIPREINGVRLVFIPTIYRKNLEAIVHTFLSSVHALFRNYDIIHYHGVGPATLAWIPRLFKPRTKVVVTFHSQDRFHAKWSLVGRLYLHFGEFAAAWFPNACIAVSHTIQVFCRKYYRRQVIYIPNGAVPHVVRKTDQLDQFGLSKGEYLLYVGRVVRHKGLHYLIEAFQKIKTKKKLVIVGVSAHTDAYVQELQKRAAGDPNIMFIGFQTGQALKQLFAHSYLYVQPSESEGLSVSVLEAMSFGTAVLVSDIPENLEAIDHVGFRFKNKNVKDLTKKLQEIEDDPKGVKEAAKDLKKWMVENFSWERIVERTEETYRSIRH